jgi:hypothetical protein
MRRTFAVTVGLGECQADPNAEGRPSQEMAPALSLLAYGRQVRLEGVGHALFFPHKEPALSAITSFFEGFNDSE